MKALNTWVEVLHYVEANYDNPTALNNRDEHGWHATSTHEFVRSVRELALGLHDIGVKRGDKVGILVHPSPQWTIADCATLSIGAVSVPLFANISDENFVFEATQSGMKTIFVEGEEQWQVYQKHHDLFHHTIAVDGHKHPGAISWQELLERGRRLHEAKPVLYSELQSAVVPDDLAAIIYTSGSTGVPKGAELTHYNLTCVVNFDKFYWDQSNDRYLSILPLAHVFGHCVNLWLITWGVSIYYFNDYKKLGSVCEEVKPTAMVVVPRLLEKVYAKMLEGLHHSHGLKHLIGKWAFNLARVENSSLFNKLMLPLSDRLVYAKLRNALGGKLRIVISGGAALNPHLQHFFETIGIPIYEGWGLTEACPVCVNIPAKNKPGTVGPPVTGQEILISDEGEILVRGSLVMKGYYRSPELTAQTLDGEGWLHTGDRGEIDEDGYLKIVGRLKELYKTSTGEYVAPVPIEQALGRHPLIDMVMVVAEGRKFTSCLIFPNYDVLRRLKSQQKENGISDEAFLRNPYIKKEMDRLLNEVNQHLNHWEQIHDYRFILEPLTVQGGELTPSMKIRRGVVSKKYNEIIEEMYREEEE